MTYMEQETFEKIKRFYEQADSRGREIMEQEFPELRESEDERIRRTLVEYFGPKAQLDFVRGVPIQKIRDWLEKQKDQNGEDEECTDFTIYHPLKNGKGKYKCIPYSFYGSLTSFSEDKDLIDFLRTCFYTEEECNEWIEQQKDQDDKDLSEKIAAAYQLGLADKEKQMMKEARNHFVYNILSGNHMKKMIEIYNDEADCRPGDVVRVIIFKKEGEK